MEREEIFGFDEIHVATVMSWAATGGLMLLLSWFIGAVPGFDYEIVLRVLTEAPLGVSFFLVVVSIFVFLAVLTVALAIPCCAVFFLFYEIFRGLRFCFMWAYRKSVEAYRKAHAREIYEAEIVKEATTKILGK